MMYYTLTTTVLILIIARVDSMTETQKDILTKTGMMAQWEASAAEENTRVACTDVGWECSSDCSQLGYCDGTNWNAVLSCSSGQLCVNGACGNYASCPASSINYDVLCSDPSLKMPDLEDTSCQNYYSCTSTTTSELGYGKRETCPSGQVFERCSGQCTTGDGCSSFDIENSCNISPTIFTTTLNSNRRLAYSCIAATSGIQTLWMTCSQGYFIESGGSSLCVSGLNYGCTNGNGEQEGDGGSCKFSSQQLCNTSTYNLCFPDGSSLQYSCDAGLYFDDTTMECKRLANIEK